MHAPSRRFGLAGVLVVAGLLLLGTGCGGSSSKSSSSTTTASSSATTANSSATTASGGNGAACLGLEGDLAKISAQVTAAFTSNNAMFDLSQLASELQAATPNVPDSIKSDWQTVVTSFTAFVDSIKGVNMTDMTNPATVAQIQAAATAFNTAAVQQASDNVTAWVDQNCKTN